MPPGAHLLIPGRDAELPVGRPLDSAVGCGAAAVLWLRLPPWGQEAVVGSQRSPPVPAADGPPPLAAELGFARRVRVHGLMDLYVTRLRSSAVSVFEGIRPGQRI